MIQKSGILKSKYVDLFLIILLIISGVIIWTHRSELFMHSQYDFTTVSEVCYGNSGKHFVIDQGREVINIVNSDHVLFKQIRGGRYDRFYYAYSVAEDKDGVIYIADTAYNDEGVEENRVVCLKNGKYSILYSAMGKQIYELQEYEGDIYFLGQEDFGLGLYRIENGNEAVLTRQIYLGDTLNDASIDLSTDVVAIAARRGDVRILPDRTSTWLTLKKDVKHVMPMGISARGGSVYFTDMYQGRVCYFAQNDVSAFTDIYMQAGAKFMYINASPDGRGALCSDYVSYFDFSYDPQTSVSATYAGSVSYREFWKTIVLWMLILLSLLILIRLLRFIPGLLLNMLHNESAVRMLAVVIAVITVSCFIAWSLLSDTYEKEDNEDINGMKLFADLVLNGMDTSLLKNIEWETDYDGSSFTKMRDTLDEFMGRAYAGGKDYYYVLYGVKDGKLRYLMNYYDSVTCGEPFNMDDRYYMDTYNTGTYYALKSQDADGLWLYVLCPVVNDIGENIAVMEIGTDLSYRQQERNSRTTETILSVFCSAAVMMMLIVEALFLMGFFERKRSTDPEKMLIPDTIPLRTVILLSYAASTIQDSFITTLSSSLYTGNLPVSPGIAVGLPLASELLMMAAFAVAGGRMGSRFGTKKTLYTGVFIEICGFVVCAVFGSYTGLLFGNVLVGIGMGIINVTANTLAAMGDSLEATSQAFADIMAGILSGLTIGAGLASLLYPIGGSRLSYTIAASFMVPVLFLISGSVDVRPDEDKEEEVNTDGRISKIGFGRFFFNLRVLGFFAFVLVPFMISVSYREYFLPMYVTDNGIAETRVGQIFLICGLLVIYIGPHISNYVIKRFGTFWSVIIASLAMGVNMFMFVVYPSILTAIAGIFVLSMITSFAYTCQYTFFEQLPDCEMYGDGRSMGIYSIFENLGQTIGPVVYGIFLGFGYRTGIGIMGSILLVFIIAYIMMMKISGQSKFFE